MARKERVTKIIDGDTFKTASRKNSIRLANVNAPELGTKSGSVAKRGLSNLIAGKTVSVDTVARDKYGRTIANVKVGQKSVNKAMRTKTGK